jgi:hypothetical protein
MSSSTARGRHCRRPAYRHSAGARCLSGAAALLSSARSGEFKPSPPWRALRRRASCTDCRDSHACASDVQDAQPPDGQASGRQYRRKRAAAQPRRRRLQRLCAGAVRACVDVQQALAHAFGGKDGRLQGQQGSARALPSACTPAAAATSAVQVAAACFGDRLAAGAVASATHHANKTCGVHQPVWRPPRWRRSRAAAAPPLALRPVVQCALRLQRCRCCKRRHPCRCAKRASRACQPKRRLAPRSWFPRRTLRLPSGGEPAGPRKQPRRLKPMPLSRVQSRLGAPTRHAGGPRAPRAWRAWTRRAAGRWPAPWSRLRASFRLASGSCVPDASSTFYRTHARCCR